MQKMFFTTKTDFLGQKEEITRVNPFLCKNISFFGNAARIFYKTRSFENSYERIVKP